MNPLKWISLCLSIGLKSSSENRSQMAVRGGQQEEEDGQFYFQPANFGFGWFSSLLRLRTSIVTCHVGVMIDSLN
jgi:hypothetical protein